MPLQMPDGADAGVYSRNRNFRLFLSAKFGRTAVLCEAADTCFAPTIPNVKRQCAVFFDSLVCNVRFSSNTRVLAIPSGAVPSSMRASQPADGLEYLGATSPFPAIDAFVLSCVRDGSVVGGIRSATYFSQGRLRRDRCRGRRCGRHQQAPAHTWYLRRQAAHL